jgi:hypothetical protein
MQKGTFTRWFSAWFLVWLLAAVILLCLSFGIRVTAAAEAPAGTPATDPRFAMSTALRAAGPHPSLGEHASVLGRLIGSWDVEYMDIGKDGKAIHRSGELLVGWVLDGRAIEDLWIVYPEQAGKEREVYADLRYFDPKSQNWPAIFIDPQAASFATFAGGAAGNDRIVLDSRDLVAGQTRRWSFIDIRGDSLVFRDDASSDGGKTWTLKSEYHMKRRSGAPALR